MVDYIQYFGNLTVEININERICLFNINTAKKLYGEERKVPSKFDPAAVRRCDFIFSTDERAECCEPESIKQIVERTHALYIAPRPALEKVEIKEKNKIEVAEGEKFNIKGLDVEVCHSSQPRAQHSVGFILNSPKYRIYYAGETYIFSSIGQIKADIALLPIKGTHMMDYFDAVQASKEIRPKYVIPLAYENNLDSEGELKEFINSLPQYSKPIIIRPGQIAKLP
ncbi:MAG: MBL fold metallo-hydrolase [Candidatus Micrarchaeota archaeon]|nr:MBL fold metallo-hydrolase [Candidatus Micrarchaeota archaeon]